MTLDAQLEAILFWRGEPVRIVELANSVGRKEGEVREALAALRERLAGRGVALLTAGDEVELRSAPEASVLLERLQKEELRRDLGKAGQETLAIVLYYAPVSRREIDYIRGVNSTFILRNLLMRGLIDRETSGTDERVFLYRPTTELLAFLGVSSPDDLPEYRAMRAERDAALAAGSREPSQSGDNDNE